jgi:hypothetical protein
MTTLKAEMPDIVFDAMINAPVSDKEWAEALVACASTHGHLRRALVKVFHLEQMHISPQKWDDIEEAAHRLNPKPPEFLDKSRTAMVFLCENFVNASLCVFASNQEEAVNWILSGKDKKRVVLPRKPSTRPRRTGARLILNNFRERDDSTAWNKCK